MPPQDPTDTSDATPGDGPTQAPDPTAAATLPATTFPARSTPPAPDEPWMRFV